jgi:biotin carboxyl carrier protein
MHYEVEVGGRIRRVTVARVGGQFAVTVDGRTRQVDVARIGAHMLSLIGEPLRGERMGGPREVHREVQEVVLAPGPTAQVTVSVGPAAIPVSLNGSRRGRRSAAENASGTGPQRLLAPMPGKIVRVLVKTGDQVQSRQPLVVVEAMKMENELRAAREGTVAEVPAREGASVDAGALLVVIR